MEKLRGKCSFKTLKEVTTSFIHSMIKFCTQIYLKPEKNQSLVQKKLNSAMRLVSTDWDESVAGMLSRLCWLNVANMWRWCSIRLLKRFLSCPAQTLHTHTILKNNLEASATTFGTTP